MCHKEQSTWWQKWKEKKKKSNFSTILKYKHQIWSWYKHLWVLQHKTNFKHVNNTIRNTYVSKHMTSQTHSQTTINKKT